MYYGGFFMTEKKKFNYMTLLKGMAISVIFSFILILIITCICYWGNISEKILGLMLFVTSALSVFISSLFMARKIERAGLIYGTLNGLGYFLIILVAAICFSGKFTPSTQSITMLIGSVLAGALGGIIGINR